jgi:hypothetical protein
MAEGPDQVKLAEADKMALEAMRLGDETRQGRELRARAAELRVNAIGERSYPVLICDECLQITGWTTREGRCDSCLRRAQTQAAYADPHGGFVLLDDTRRSNNPRSSATRSGPGLLGRLVGGRSAHQRTRIAAWLSRVDPDQTGPVVPESDYEIEVAHRDQFEAADRSGLLIQFRTATHRFVESTWVELETTRVRRAHLALPTEQSAALPAEQLVEAWLDYQTAVEQFNRDRWAEQAAQREASRLAEAAHADALHEQERASELLDEN